MTKMALPFRVPDPLPTQISPCPIADAVLELRFVPARPWDHFPGLFAQKFGKEYPNEVSTGLSNIPEQFRQIDPVLQFGAYRRLEGSEFAIQIGPRSVGLALNQPVYPGWDKFSAAMQQLLTGVEEMRIVKETIRVGVRYINFFPRNVFDLLNLAISIDSSQLNLPETVFSTVLWDNNFRHHVQISNNATLVRAPAKVGSIVDIDTTSEVSNIDSFPDISRLFAAAHQSEKKVFFGLLRQDFLDSLSVIR